MFRNASHLAAHAHYDHWGPCVEGSKTGRRRLGKAVEEWGLLCSLSPEIGSL